MFLGEVNGTRTTDSFQQFIQQRSAELPNGMEGSCPLSMDGATPAADGAKKQHEISVADVVMAITRSRGMHINGEKYAMEVGNSILAAKIKHPM